MKKPRKKESKKERKSRQKKKEGSQGRKQRRKEAKEGEKEARKKYLIYFAASMQTGTYLIFLTELRIGLLYTLLPTARK